MKKILFVLLLPLFSFYCYAQNNNVVLAKAFYIFKHQQDSLKKDSSYSENMSLVISRDISIFSSLDKLEQANRIERDQDEQVKNWTGPGSPKFKSLTNLRKTSSQDIYQFQKEQKILIKEYLIINYLYEDSLEFINWTLGSEFKNFDKIKCQSATAFFKGRQWIAWFASDIPFETGPWKLHGLPGLIMEAYDEKREIQFLFSGFESVPKNPKDSRLLSQSIELPKNVAKVSLENIKKLKAKMYNNPRGFINAQITASGGIVDSRELSGFSYKKQNNPIDLTEYK